MSLFSVAGKNVLVTGGSRGIGLMVAKGFLNAGANVLLTSRSEDACAEAAASLEASKTSDATCSYVASNVSNREGCEKLAEHVAEVFDNRLDVLINNAGASWGEPLERNSGKANWGWDKVLDLNVKGIFYMTHAFIPLLEKSATQEDPSRIINIGSIVGFVPQAAPTHAYDVSKAAVHHLTKKLSADLAPKQITVNCLAPGFVPSRMSDGLKSWGATRDKIAEAVPLGRMGNEDDMAGACLYFSSKAGSWCTGVILNVDGGAVGALQIPLSSL
eukprot:Nitzschia sp. Nitz4//scaffold89_size161592//130989//131961//NITZ4_002396-RA/size161592-processed-gene-0.58-mRNA-1//-1//CDS//3329559670//3180//frame0